MYIKLKTNIKLKIIITILTMLTFFSISYVLLYKNSYDGKFTNSFINSKFISNKTVMVIVPHEDDDIFLAGSTIKNLVLANDNVKVVFTTNGDYYGKGLIRIKEAIRGLKTLGVPEQNIIFLGYGDQWQTKYNHIYNAPDNEVIMSHVGKTKTYGIKNHPDFRTSISSSPSLYTRGNYKKDLKDVILKYSPDVIFSSDIDLHVDHRAETLLFDEVINEILKSNLSYTPKIFKGFAYNTSCEAKNDFYKLNMESTVIPEKTRLNNPLYELDVPNYNWNDRVRFPVPASVLSYTKRSSLIYKTLSRYSSQQSTVEAGQVINSDQVFWERKTTSITYKAKIEVSSGNSKYLNDFKLIDSSNIMLKNMILNNCVWIPDLNDTKKTVRIMFDSTKDISQVSLYDNFSLNDNILKSTLNFSDGTSVNVGVLNKNGSETIVEFPKKNNISYVEYKIDEWEGSNPGLSELEIYENKQDVKTQYIKLMVDNNKQTFIYKYIVTNEKEIPLNVYMYPSNNLADNIKKCKIYIKDNKNKNLELIDNKLIIHGNTKSGKYIIRAELLDDSSVFDEIEVYVPNIYELKYIKFVIDYEKTLDNISQGFQNIINGTVNFSKKTFRNTRIKMKSKFLYNKGEIK